MSDERLRRLERESAQGDPTARAGLLSERMRTGALRVDRVRLAAALGDPAAVLAAGAPAELPSFAGALADEARAGGSRAVARRRAERRHASAWCERVAEAGGTPALVRAALAGVEVVARDVPLTQEARAALDAAVRWVEAVEASDERRRAGAWAPPDGSEGEGDPAVAEASTAAIAAGDVAALSAQSAGGDRGSGETPRRRDGPSGRELEPGRGVRRGSPDPGDDAGHYLTLAASLVAYAAGSTSRSTAADNVQRVLERASAAWTSARNDAPGPEDASRTLRPDLRQAVSSAIAAWALQ